MITIKIIVVKIIMHNMILTIIVIIINVTMVPVDKVLPVTCLHTRPVCGTAGTGLKKSKISNILFLFRSIFVKFTNNCLPSLPI